MSFTKEKVELHFEVLDILQDMGYIVPYGREIGPVDEYPKRENYEDPILSTRLNSALLRINPSLSQDYINDVCKRVSRIDSSNLLVNNKNFHKMLIKGIKIEDNYEGSTKQDHAKIIDFENPDNNEFLAMSEYRVMQGEDSSKRIRVLDIVIFINGIPIVVIELKKPSNVDDNLEQTFRQIENYKEHLTSFFRTNELIIISNGYKTLMGGITSNFAQFSTWQSNLEDFSSFQFDFLFRDLLDPHKLLDYIRFFISFMEDQGRESVKMYARYHQYYAVNRAVIETIRSTSQDGDRKIGVVLHTQGSGRAMTMIFYAGKIIQMLVNPTLLIITDRNDLNNQLLDIFTANSTLICQSSVRTNCKMSDPLSSPYKSNEIRNMLKTSDAGIIFSTIQKLIPDYKEQQSLISNRRNIIVIVDEAHRAQYAYSIAKKINYNNENVQNSSLKERFSDVLKKALPNASFIGFTSTPIDLLDRNTMRIFGDYISVYDISQAIFDKFTVPIYYESRVARIKLNQELEGKIDPKFEDITEDEDESIKDKFKIRLSRIAKLISDPNRITEIAKDIISHFQSRQEIFKGKGLIVCMNRDIAIQMYNELVNIKPEWHSCEDEKGFIKIVMSGSASDKTEIQPHIRSKAQQRVVEMRFKDPKDDLKLVIVIDMWLTGFDVPPLHTMYIDKPMKDHYLMQAIARVNRRWKDKTGGLIVDYIGIGPYLRRALSKYSRSSQENIGIPLDVTIDIMKKYHELLVDIFIGFDYSPFAVGSVLQKQQILPTAMEHILSLGYVPPETAKTQFLDYFESLNNAFSLSMPHKEALKLKGDIAFFHAVKIGFIKFTINSSGNQREEIEITDTHMISGVDNTEDMIDIFSAVGLQRPKLSCISEDFIERIKTLKHKNLAVELLNKLIHDLIRLIARTNLVQSRSFEDRLNKSIYKYSNRTVEPVIVLEELIIIVNKMQKAFQQGKNLDMDENEIALYNALITNENVLIDMNSGILKEIAKELVVTVRNSITVDFIIKRSVQAKMRITIRRLLRKYKYPPDQIPEAVLSIIEQIYLFGNDWVNDSV